MTNHERRHSVALDECFNYCRRLEANEEQPRLFKLCNAIATLDRALAGEHEDVPIPLSLCNEAWSQVRDSLYSVLITAFSGRVEFLDETGNPIETGAAFPRSGFVEFFPDRINRRRDKYICHLERLTSSIVTVLRWHYAENQEHITPRAFVDHVDDEEADENEENGNFAERLYDVCAEEALEGKKKAHRKWWQLYWEASSCPNNRTRHQLRKQMVALEGIWGKPEK